MTASLADLQPIMLQRVARPAAAKIWNASVDCHHYLGDKHPFGCQMKVFDLRSAAADPGVSAVRGDDAQSALSGQPDRLEPRAEEQDPSSRCGQFALRDFRRGARAESRRDRPGPGGPAVGR